jgi:hypothetical protein
VHQNDAELFMEINDSRPSSSGLGRTAFAEPSIPLLPGVSVHHAAFPAFASLFLQLSPKLTLIPIPSLVLVRARAYSH